MQEFHKGDLVVVQDWATKIDGLTGTVWAWSEMYREYAIEYPEQGNWRVPEHYVHHVADILEDID